MGSLISKRKHIKNIRNIKCSIDNCDKFAYDTDEFCFFHSSLYIGSSTRKYIDHRITNVKDNLRLSRINRMSIVTS